MACVGVGGWIAGISPDVRSRYGLVPGRCVWDLVVEGCGFRGGEVFQRTGVDVVQAADKLAKEGISVEVSSDSETLFDGMSFRRKGC